MVNSEKIIVLAIPNWGVWQFPEKGIVSAWVEEAVYASFFSCVSSKLMRKNIVPKKYFYYQWTSFHTLTL